MSLATCPAAKSCPSARQLPMCYGIFYPVEFDPPDNLINFSDPAGVEIMEGNCTQYDASFKIFILKEYKKIHWHSIYFCASMHRMALYFKELMEL